MDNLSYQGVTVPALGYGTYELRGEQAAQSVATALDIGYRHIDTAQIYGNEAEVGTGIKNSGVARDQVFLTTKVWRDKVANGTLQKSVEESLRKLQTEYVDLLLIHWPVEEVAFEEQLRALQDVQKAGKTRLIGVSNFTVAQLKEVTEEIGAGVATDQVEYHPTLSQKPVLEFLRSKGMFLTAYSPLARGGVRDEKVLQEIGRAHGKTPGQVTLRWLIQQGDVAAIPKAASEKHMRENFAIFDFALTAAEMQKIHALARADGRLIEPDFAPEWDVAA